MNENKFRNNNLLRNNNSDKTLYVFLISFLIVCLYTPVLFAGSASLSWDAPTENTDGTRLTDLAGYNIYYGTAAGDYSNSINVGNITTHQITNLSDGSTYYFAVTAYDTSMNESDYSKEVSRTVGTVNNSPTSHPGGPYAGVEGEGITLNGSGSSDSDGTIVLYEWDIDNNGTYEYSSSSSAVVHKYIQKGSKTIKLRVTDNFGAKDEATTTANIADASPIAGFTASATNGTAPLTIQFTSNAAGYDQSFTYSWDFDNDGSIDSTSSDPSLSGPSYTYSDAGTYTVKLTVTDLDGSSNSLTRTDYITVRPSTVSLYTLSIRKPGRGRRTVTSNLAGIKCGTDCNEDYSAGMVVSLRATPDRHSTRLKNKTSISDPSIAESVEISSSKVMTAQPDTRFSDNGDGTATDNLTGLMWTLDTNLSGQTLTWQEALDHVEDMNAGFYRNFGYSDWRLPNINELESLIEAGYDDPAFPLGDPLLFWSSTSSDDCCDMAWSVDFSDGRVYGGLSKMEYLSFLPIMETFRQVHPGRSVEAISGFCLFSLI